MRDALLGLGLVLGALLACRAKEDKLPAPTVASAAVAPAPTANEDAVDASADASGERVYSASAAVFNKERMVACVDLAFASPIIEMILKKGKVDGGATALSEDELRGVLRGDDSLVGRAFDKTFGTGSTAKLKLKGELTPIPKECHEQFPTRTAVGSCLVKSSTESDAGVRYSAAVAYTYYSSLGLDGAMKRCLALKGDWQELASDSAERRRVEARQLIDQLGED